MNTTIVSCGNPFWCCDKLRCVLYTEQILSIGNPYCCFDKLLRCVENEYKVVATLFDVVTS